jgi:Transposase, Mutator family
MALDQSALLEVLDALKVADVGDRVRQAVETVYQALIEAELTDTIGAALHERSEHRTNLRNGDRTRILSTTTGDLELRIPKLRAGSFYPASRAEAQITDCDTVLGADRLRITAGQQDVSVLGTPLGVGGRRIRERALRSPYVVTCAASAASRIRHGQCAPGVPVPGVVHARHR